MAAFPAAMKKKAKEAAITTPAANQHSQDTSTMVAAKSPDKDASKSTDRTTESMAAAESSANEKGGFHKTPAAKSSRMKGYVYVEVNPDDNCTPERDTVGTNEKRKRKQKKLFDV